MKEEKNNRGKSRLLNFNLGLIVALSLVLASFEWGTYSLSEREIDFDDLYENVDMLEDIKPVQLKRTEVKTRKTTLTKIKIVDILPPEDPDPDPKPDPEIKPKIGVIIGDTDEPDVKETSITTFMASAVEIAPYYQECENVLDRKEQADCSYFMIKEYVQKTAKYPQMCIDGNIEGTVLVEFVVSRSGKISNVKAVRSVHPLLDKSAIAAVEQLPELIPARQQGVKVPVIYHMPVSFTITGN